MALWWSEKKKTLTRSSNAPFYAIALGLALFVIQLPGLRFALAYDTQRGLLPQIETFAEGFGSNDLILVDREATGNPYAMLTGPANFLFSANTVYFFNPNDLAAIDTSRFNHVYLLTPQDSLARYSSVFGERMVFQGNVVFETENVEPGTLADALQFHFPQKEVLRIEDLLFQVY
ncbi:MAG: hypothetical protein WDN67_05555 [Candidatus Moraniibacteriota bacterium]